MPRNTDQGHERRSQTAATAAVSMSIATAPWRSKRANAAGSVSRPSEVSRVPRGGVSPRLAGRNCAPVARSITKLRNDEISDRDAGSDAARDAHDEHVIDCGGIEDPLHAACRGADPDSGLRGDDLHPTGRSGVERVLAGSRPTQGEPAHEGGQLGSHRCEQGDAKSVRDASHFDAHRVCRLRARASSPSRCARTCGHSGAITPK